MKIEIDEYLNLTLHAAGQGCVELTNGVRAA